MVMPVVAQLSGMHPCANSPTLQERVGRTPWNIQPMLADGTPSLTSVRGMVHTLMNHPGEAPIGQFIVVLGIKHADQTAQRQVCYATLASILLGLRLGQ